MSLSKVNRIHGMTGFLNANLCAGGHSMKHSKSMPDHSSCSRKLTNKWPSMNTDSGISMFSADTVTKYKDARWVNIAFRWTNPTDY